MHLPKSRQTSHTSLVSLAVAVALMSGCSAADNAEKLSPQLELDSPLSKYWSAMYGEKERTEELARQGREQAEDAVAECMKAEGFTYTPQLELEGQNAESPVVQHEDTPTPGSLEYAKEYGYGMVLAPSNEEVDSGGKAEVNPNAEYYSSLRDSGKRAYDIALYGSELNQDLTPANERMAEENEGGCRGKSDSLLKGDENRFEDAFDDPEFKELLDNIETFQTTSLETEDVAALNKKWSACVVDAGGEPAADPYQYEMILNEEHNRMLYPDGEGSVHVEPDERALSLFQDREIQAAVIDARCRLEIKYVEKIRKIRFDAENEFVEAHKAELERFVSAHGSKGN